MNHSESPQSLRICGILIGILFSPPGRDHSPNILLYFPYSTAETRDPRCRYWLNVSKHIPFTRVCRPGARGEPESARTTTSRELIFNETLVAVCAQRTTVAQTIWKFNVNTCLKKGYLRKFNRDDKRL